MVTEDAAASSRSKMDFSSKNGSMMQQAQQIWGMLDDMAQNDPEAYRKFIDRQMQDAKEVRQPPVPHMCVHVKNLKSQKSLYINVCSWNKLPSPKSDTAPIPVSGGEIYEEEIHGSPSDLITVAFNESVLNDFGMDSTLMAERNMLVNLALDYIEDQHKVKLSRSYTVYPKKEPFKGSKEGLVKYFMKKYNGGDEAADEKFESELTELEKSFGPMADGCKDTLLAKLANMADDEKADIKDDGDSDKSSLLDKLTNISVTSANDSGSMKGNSKKSEEISSLASSENSGIQNKGPIIQEINTESNAVQISQEKVTDSGSSGSQLDSELSEKPRLKKPEHTVEITGQEKDKSLCVKVKLEGVKSVSECELHVSQHHIELEVTDRYYLKLTLPCAVNEEDAKAQFKRKSHLLILQIPVLNS